MGVSHTWGQTASVLMALLATFWGLLEVGGWEVTNSPEGSWVGGQDGRTEVDLLFIGGVYVRKE